MGLTCSKRLFISLHFAKKRVKIDQVRAELIPACQTLWGSKSKVAETHFPGR